MSIGNDWLFALAVICGTLVIAIATRPVFVFIKSRFKKLADRVYNAKNEEEKS